MNVVVSPAAMLKLLQFKNAPWLAVTLSCEPFCCAVAEPWETVIPVGFAKIFMAKADKNPATTIRHSEEFCFKARMTISVL